MPELPRRWVGVHPPPLPPPPPPTPQKKEKSVQEKILSKSTFPPEV